MKCFERTLFLAGIWLCSLLTESLQAQVTAIRVVNPNDRDVYVRYWPQNQAGTVDITTDMIPANDEKALPLNGEDRWDFHCWQAGDARLQAVVGTLEGVPLKRMAERGVKLRCDTTLAETVRDGRRLRQVMSVTLTEVDSGNEHPSILPSGEESEFVREVLNRQWQTAFRTLGGDMNTANLSFNNMEFRAPQFDGRLHHLASFENKSKVTIFARWSGPDGREAGEVIFYVMKDDPNRLLGTYTADQRPGERFQWNSR